MTSGKLQSFFQGLDELEKDVLHLATLFGETFSLDNILENIDIKPSRLLTLIDEMIDLGIITNTSTSIKGSFSFVHMAFLSLIINAIPDDKRKLHIDKIAAFLERNLQSSKESAIALSNLYIECNRKYNKLDYLQKAADLLVSVHMAEKAIPLYEKIIESLLVPTRDEQETPILIESLVSYAMLVVYIQPKHNLRSIITEVLSIAIETGNQKAEAILELCLGILFQRKGKSEESILHCEKGWGIAQKSNDIELKKTASKLLALSLFYRGKMTDVIQIYEEEIGNIEIISSDLNETWCCLRLAWCYGIAGRIGRGLGLAHAVMERAKLKGFPQTESFAHGVIALILLEARRLKDAQPHIDAAIEICERINGDFILFMMKPCKAYINYVNGDLKDIRELVSSGLSYIKDRSLHYPCPWFLEVLFAFEKFKWKAIEGYAFKSVINRLIKWPDIYMQGAAFRYLAESIPFSEETEKEIEQLLLKSDALLREAGAWVESGRAQIELAKFYVNTKNISKARKFAKSAYRVLTEIDDALFPSHMGNLIPRKFKDSIKDHGLSELLTAIDLLPDTDKYLGRVVTILTDLFGAERAAVVLLPGQTQNRSFNFIATRNFTPEEIEQFQDHAIQDLVLTAVAKKDFILLSDRDDNNLITDLRKNGIYIRSLALVPLIFDNDIAGLVYLDNRLLSGILSKNDVQVLKNIAIQLSIVLKSLDIYSSAHEFSRPVTDHFSSAESSENFELTSPLIIGKSKVIHDVLVDVKKVAGTDSTVLIYGETGVGKELIAHAVYQYSRRNKKPFIIVNVSALTTSIIESELFGYEKGAFTGAVGSKPGRFELANGGTLFLDEIGDLTLDAQVKLLRVLQEGEFERVGGNRTIVTEFRLIAATNKNLYDMVTKGEFRSDLYYRINSFPIKVPPLRERKEDIPALALHFMNKFATKNKKDIKSIPNSEMEKLMRYPWYGNVRELEHVIEKAVVLSDDEKLSISDLLPSHSGMPMAYGAPNKLAPLEEIEREHMIKVLDHTKWRIRGKNGAAKILGLKPTTMEFRMKKLGINK
ncbi:MAG: sigma 54-interacting transcriptional regulator [Desulfobacterales bacterium]|nr:sigma 54-interacting transcriptional regulator [Desulfobacterales bacterium]